MVNEGLLTNSQLIELVHIRDHYQAQFQKYPYEIQEKGGTSLVCEFKSYI